jgi:hypothetical protein
MLALPINCAKIQTGAHVFIEGELVYREYDRTIETKADLSKCSGQ